MNVATETVISVHHLCLTVNPCVARQISSADPRGSVPRARGTIGVVVVKRSASNYAETVATLLGGIERRGLTVFARIDHAGGARAVGLELADEELIVFGSPRAGTPLMASDPRCGIELPLRMLVWSHGDDVLLGYRDPRELRASYDLLGHEPILDQMAALLDALAVEATA